jgi:uncharacterized OB-fold protein
MESEFLIPGLDDDSTGFWQGCADRELRVQRCRACSHRQFPPRQQCPVCHSFDLDWEAVSGEGVVWSFVVPHPPLLPAYGDLAPYNVIVVALAEDPSLRMVGNLVAHEGAPINSLDPSSIEIGQRVRVVFDQVDEDIWLPRWIPG